MIPEEEKTPGTGNSVNAKESVSSDKQQTPDFGTPSVQGSRKAAGRAGTDEKYTGTNRPRQSTSAGSSVENAPTPGRDMPAEKTASDEQRSGSGPFPGDKNPEKGPGRETGKPGPAAATDNAVEIRKEESPETPSRYAHIPGWGIDADSGNDPTYPMRDRETGVDRKEKWERPVVQPLSVELLYSTEHTTRPAVFGTASPPSGLSGVLRRRAFRYSESDYRHWLPLIVADRINVVEGIVSDFAHGRLPNPIAERGLKAEWKYNRKAVIKKAAVTVGVVSLVAAAAILTRGKKKTGLKALFR